MAIHKDFSFIGRLSLDFAQTGDMGWGDRYERLTSPAELQRWMSLSPLRLPRMPISSTDVVHAKALRGAIWRIAGAIIDAARPIDDDIKTLNRVGTRPVLVRELQPRGGALRWHRPDVAAALATIAQDAVLLFGESSQRERLRRCENHPRCRVVFYDDSRPGLRRWCAPNRCGDRVRAQAYRERNRP